MINASKQFKEKLKKGANVVNYADLTLSDGTVLHLEPKDFMIRGCTVEDKTTDGKFGVGFCIGKTLTLRIANHDERFSQYDFYKSIIYLYVALALDDRTVEKIRKGVYYTLVPESPGDIIEVSAVDGMYRLDKDYAASTTVYPATLQTILSEACGDCGIPVGFGRFDNMDFIVESKPDKATYRQVVSWAAQIAGYNARIDNSGYMQLVWYDTDLLNRFSYDGGNFKVYPHDTVIDGGNFRDYSADTILSGGTFTDEMPEHVYQIKSLSVCTDDVQITGVKVFEEEEEYELFGEEGYLIEVRDNPFTAGKERAVADYLGNRIVGMVFRPFSAEVLNNPLYEPFDIVRFPDRKGNMFVSLLNSVSYTVGSYTQVACEAEDPIRNGSAYFSDAAAAVVEAKRETGKQITEYDKAVQNMNGLAMRAMGFHTTYENKPDGSRITYLHDKPSLADSKTIYKQTIDGFFISTDGGKSYTSGFDSNGNVVVNILYAIGIVADWIRTGRFVVKKGDKTTFLADADTGEVRIVADAFELSSGKTIESIADEKADAVLDIAKNFTNGEIAKYSSTVNSSFKVVNDAISAEVRRATEAEGVIDGKVVTFNQNLSSRVTQTEKGIDAEVKRATEVEDTLSKNIASVKITADGVKSTVTDITKEGGTLSTMQSQINQNASGITSKVSKGDVSSQISQEAGKISIKSNRLSITSDYFKLTETGRITATSGSIGGFDISATQIKGSNPNDEDQIIALQVPGSNMNWALAIGEQSRTTSSPGVAGGLITYTSCAFRVSKSGALVATSASIKGRVIADDVILKSISVKANNAEKYFQGSSNDIVIDGVAHHFAHGIYVGTSSTGSPNAPFEIN